MTENLYLQLEQRTMPPMHPPCYCSPLTSTTKPLTVEAINAVSCLPSIPCSFPSISMQYSSALSSRRGCIEIEEASCYEAALRCSSSLDEWQVVFQTRTRHAPGSRYPCVTASTWQPAIIGSVSRKDVIYTVRHVSLHFPSWRHCTPSPTTSSAELVLARRQA